MGTPKSSRFVLYDNGAFVLQYMNPDGSLCGQYRGSYTAENGVLNFRFEGNFAIGCDRQARR